MPKTWPVLYVQKCLNNQKYVKPEYSHQFHELKLCIHAQTSIFCDQAGCKHKRIYYPY